MTWQRCYKQRVFLNNGMVSNDKRSKTCRNFHLEIGTDNDVLGGEALTEGENETTPTGV